LEISKGEHKNPAVLVFVLKTFLKLLHPFTPFVTEKLWEILGEKSLLINEKWPVYDKTMVYQKEVKEMEYIKEIIDQIRSIRAELKVEPSKKIHAIIYGGIHTKQIESKREVIMRLARLEKLEISKSGKKISQAKSIIIQHISIYLPMKDLIDMDKEQKRIKHEIEGIKKTIEGLNVQLANKSFTKNAPAEIVEKVRAHLKEETAKLQNLQKQLSA
jgi:valyl-tRNA synthetase